MKLTDKRLFIVKGQGVHEFAPCLLTRFARKATVGQHVLAEGIDARHFTQEDAVSTRLIPSSHFVRCRFHVCHPRIIRLIAVCFVHNAINGLVIAVVLGIVRVEGVPVVQRLVRVFRNRQISRRRRNRERAFKVRTGQLRFLRIRISVELILAVVIAQGVEDAVLDGEQVGNLVAAEVIQLQIRIRIQVEADRLIRCRILLCPAVRVAHRHQGVFAVVQLIALRAVVVRVRRVVGSHVLHVDSDVQRLCLTGEQFVRLAEADELHMRLFHFAGRVGCFDVDFHGFLARHAAAVGYVHLNSHGFNLRASSLHAGRQLRSIERRAVGNHFVARLDDQIAVLEVGVAQTVAEGIDNRLAVPFFACASLCCLLVRCHRLIVAVADVDAFFVVHAVIGRRCAANACGLRRHGVRFLPRHGVRHIAGHLLVADGILPDRVSGKVRIPSIYRLAGRVHRAAQDSRRTNRTGLTWTANPQDTVNRIIILKVSHLENFRGVHQVDNLLEALRLHIVQQRFFTVRQLQEMLVDFAVRLCDVASMARQILLVSLFLCHCRHVAAFATAARQHDNRHITIQSVGVLHAAVKRRVFQPESRADFLVILAKRLVHLKAFCF